MGANGLHDCLSLMTSPVRPASSLPEVRVKMLRDFRVDPKTVGDLEET